MQVGRIKVKLLVPLSHTTGGHASLQSAMVQA